MLGSSNSLSRFSITESRSGGCGNICVGGFAGFSGGFTRLKGVLPGLKGMLPGLKSPKFESPMSGLEDSWLGHDSPRGRMRVFCLFENKLVSSPLIDEKHASWVEDSNSSELESAVLSRSDGSDDSDIDSSSNISGSYDAVSVSNSS